MAPRLILGPILRYTDSREATVWVETDGACEVEVRIADSSHNSQTFHVEGHHYSLVRITGLEPGECYEYEVALAGKKVWPEPDSEFPPSVIRTLNPEASFKLAFGSCRVAVPHKPPYTLDGLEDSKGYDIDALHASALRMSREPREDWPDALLLLGDQIYADEVSFGTLEYIRSRRDTSQPPGEEVADFQEYTHLYLDSWGEPSIRWLLSTVPTAMIFDDHDVNDDWNTSADWVEKMHAKPWWNRRITSGLMSYWIYQHLGNLSPEELSENELLKRVKEADDAGPLLRDFAYKADRSPEEVRWSFHRDFGKTRLVVVDSRAGRVLQEEHRLMVDDQEWDWVERHVTGDFDHLLIGTSLPLILAPGIHYFEAWNEAVCSGVWGAHAARVAETIRQTVDLEQWPAFYESFNRFTDLLKSVAAGEHGEPPASIAVLSGDVHHTYLAELELHDPDARSPVYQATCSPFRNPLPGPLRRIFRAGWSGKVALIGRLLARSAGVKKPDIDWHLTHDGPWFNNHVATLELEGRRNVLKIEKATSRDGDFEDPTLQKIFEYHLSREDASAPAIDR